MYACTYLHLPFHPSKTAKKRVSYKSLLTTQNFLFDHKKQRDRLRSLRFEGIPMFEKENLKPMTREKKREEKHPLHKSTSQTNSSTPRRTASSSSSPPSRPTLH